MVTREAKFAFTWPLGNYIRDLSKFEVAKDLGPFVRENFVRY